MGFFIQDAYAQGAAPASDPWLSMLPLVIIFVVFYFLLIRPQQKRQKEHRDLIARHR
jgi:preprotein translocase subunit YajC